MFDFKKISISNFTKSVILVSGGTAFAQALGILLSPIITRIYPPGQYGILPVYTSILGMLAIVGSLKYDWGIAIADDDKKAINVLTLSILVLTVIVSIITIALAIFGKSFLSIFDAETLADYKYLIPIGVFLTGLYNIFMQWSFRNKDFKAISKTKFTQSITQNVTKIGLGILQIGPIGLILGAIMGQSAGISTLSSGLFKNKSLIKSINIKDIIWSAKRYVRFPLYSAPSQFLNTAGIQLPVLIITSMYGRNVIGLFGLANTIVNLPMTLIGNSIGDVFYGEAANIGRSNPKRLKELSNKLQKKLILLGIIPILILLMFGPFLFSLIFGEEWYQAGIYARILSVLVFSRLVFTPISRVFSVFERQREALTLDTLRVILVLTTFGISYFLSLNSYYAIGIYSIAMSFIYFSTYLWAQKIMNQEIKKSEV